MLGAATRLGQWGPGPLCWKQVLRVAEGSRAVVGPQSRRGSGHCLCPGTWGCGLLLPGTDRPAVAPAPRGGGRGLSVPRGGGRQPSPWRAVSSPLLGVCSLPPLRTLTQERPVCTRVSSLSPSAGHQAQHADAALPRALPLQVRPAGLFRDLRAGGQRRVSPEPVLPARGGAGVLGMCGARRGLEQRVCSLALCSAPGGRRLCGTRGAGRICGTLCPYCGRGAGPGTPSALPPLFQLHPGSGGPPRRDAVHGDLPAPPGAETSPPRPAPPPRGLPPSDCALSPGAGRASRDGSP